MKQTLKMVGGLIIWAAIGLAFATLLIWIVDGSEGLDNAMHKDINVSKLAVATICSLVSLVVAVVLQLALHEVGHLLFGLASGCRFSSIRLFKYALVKDDEGFHIRKFNIPGTAGQCIMTLPPHTDAANAPFFWYNAGGVTVNLLLLAVSLVVLYRCDCGMVAASFFYMLAFTGICTAALNGIPLSINGLSNDYLLHGEYLAAKYLVEERNARSAGMHVHGVSDSKDDYR